MVHKERESEDRKSQARKKVWRPPQSLETPAPPPGYQYRWVRYEVLGEDDAQNVFNRFRQHYEVVRAEELSEENRARYITIETGRLAGVIAVGDLILMKVPTEIANQRTRYYDDLASRQIDAVDEELAAQKEESMPFHTERKTTVTVGSPKAKFQDEG